MTEQLQLNSVFVKKKPSIVQYFICKTVSGAGQVRDKGHDKT